MRYETDYFYGLIFSVVRTRLSNRDAEYTLDVSDRLRHDYQNGRSYYPLRGTQFPFLRGDRASDSRSPRLAQSERLSAIERVMEFALPAVSPKAASLRFWYGASIAEFVGASAEKIVGQLTLNSSFDIDRSQALHGSQRLSFSNRS